MHTNSNLEKFLKEVELLANTFALDYILSSYSVPERDAWLKGELDDESFFQSSSTVVWEKFQNCQISDLVDEIDSLASQFITFYENVIYLERKYNEDSPL